MAEDGGGPEGARNPSRYRGMGPKGQKLVVRAWGIARPGDRGVCSPERQFAPTQALIDAMTQAQEGLIKFNREKDALTTALGNDEHGGRVRGKGKVPWKVGFS